MCVYEMFVSVGTFVCGVCICLFVCSLLCMSVSVVQFRCALESVRKEEVRVVGSKVGWVTPQYRVWVVD
jgi:hypothetical protein